MIKVTIGGVDGETSFAIASHSVQDVLEFLDRDDHEGSSISGVIEIENVEILYKVLETLKAADLKEIR